MACRCGQGYTAPMISKLDLEGARSAVAAFATRTPLLWAADLTARVGTDVYLKLESLQVTGSFKIRGAANRLMALTEDERSRGVVTSSSGNHGTAVAQVAAKMAVPATICVPHWVDPVKRGAMEAAGARVVLAGGTFDEADAHALTLAKEEGLTFVHPFDDPWVIAGQGTVGLEILDELPDVGELLAPLSGGGLVGGIAYGVKEAGHGAAITAVSAERATVMLESVRAGRPVEMEEEETLANALSGGIGLQNRHTFELVRSLVDGHVTVSEEATAEGIAYAARELHLVVEGGGAVGLAAALSGAWTPRCPGTPIAIVVSGGNVSAERIREVTQNRPPETVRPGS